MKNLILTIVALLTVDVAFGNDDNVVIRKKYENYVCSEAKDNGEGKPLTWTRVDLSRCGFALSKAYRKEMAIIKNNCVETHIWDSTLGYGQYKEVVYPQSNDLMNYKQCGYDTDHPIVEFKVQNNGCYRSLRIHSENANMPDLPLMDMSGEPANTADPSKCGFKPEGAHTLYEIRDNNCTEIQANLNSTGQRIVMSTKNVDVTSCGINLKSPPVATIYANSKNLNLLLSVKTDCTKVETFVSSKGLGIYQRYSKAEDGSLCNSAVEGSKGKIKQSAPGAI